MRHQSFVSLQREPVHHENKEDVTSLSEEMVQHKPDSKQEQEDFLVVPSAPYEHSSSDYNHPFGLLVKEHTPKKTVEGISFPTIKDFRHFIEAMKSSFLTPGSDLSRHFQTARETMKIELTSGAQNINGESSTRSDSVTEGSAHDDNSKNEVWREPTNTVFEQSEQDANYEKPRESFSFPDPVDFTANLISPSVYDNQDYGPVSALYPRHNFADTDHVLSNYGSLANGGNPGENPDIFTNAPEVQNEDVQSTSYMLPEQTTSGSFFGGDFYYSSQVTASPVNPPNSPSQQIGYYLSKTSSVKPITSEKNIQQPTYSSHSGDSFTGYQKPSGGFEFGNDFQREELHRVTQADVLSPQKPPSLNSYSKSLYVSAPRGQLYVPDNLPKHRERPAQSVQTYQPTVDKEKKDVNYTPTMHLPVSHGSTNSHVGVVASGPHDPQHQVFSGKQPVRSHLVFIMKPSSALHDSSRHDGYLRNQSDSRPSSLNTHAKNEEISDLSKQNLVSAIQEPEQMNDNTPIPTSSVLDLTQSMISSQVSGSFNSPTNLAPTSEPKKAFSRLFGNEVMSRNFEIRNIISDGFPSSDTYGASNPLGSFSTQQRQGISLNDVFATRAGLLQTFLQPTKVQKRPAKVNKEPSNMAYHPPKPLSASKVSGSGLNGVFWRNGGNTKRLPPQTGPNMSPPSVNAYVIKSRNGYVRGKVSLSKTYYTPYRHVEGNTAKDQWKPAPGKQKAPLYPTM
ncbi:uncharacterized protein LOC111671225 [Seriola lalandi dorsalis]|uniref:uncharacterized protein LOC111671225 n=1 Tax=Seriola lalandi dorsalis TaxID=1841481 RepID=UPI000C6F95EC|nr:uncharacterized protein LOC111671225 [Seriola lalandi dorsalis]